MIMLLDELGEAVEISATCATFMDLRWCGGWRICKTYKGVKDDRFNQG